MRNEFAGGAKSLLDDLMGPLLDSVCDIVGSMKGTFDIDNVLAKVPDFLDVRPHCAKHSGEKVFAESPDRAMQLKISSMAGDISKVLGSGNFESAASVVCGSWKKSGAF